jgi:hypothetical protein
MVRQFVLAVVGSLVAGVAMGIAFGVIDLQDSTGAAESWQRFLCASCFDLC